MKTISVAVAITRYGDRIKKEDNTLWMFMAAFCLIVSGLCFALRFLY